MKVRPGIKIGVLCFIVTGSFYFGRYFRFQEIGEAGDHGHVENEFGATEPNFGHWSSANADSFGRIQVSNDKLSHRAASEAARTFGELKEEEQRSNLMNRLGSLRDDLEKSSQPQEVVSDLLRDLNSMSGLQKLAMDGMLENKLAQLDPNDALPFAWISELYLRIQPSLQSQASVGGTYEERFFGILQYNARRMGIDVASELKSLPNSESGKIFKEKLIPELVVRIQDPYPELLESVPSETRDEIQQGVIETSARLNLYREEALNLYLNGEGLTGNHEAVVSRWFQDPAWFWGGANQIAAKIGDAPPGERRDTVLKELIPVLSANDAGNASEWSELIADPALRNRFLAETAGEDPLE